MDTFLNNLDKDKVNSLLQETEENVKYFEETCNKIIKEYSEPLDNLMLDLYNECIKDINKADIRLLERYYLELSNMIYFMVERLEKLGVYVDMSDSAAKEIYSKHYINLSSNKDVAGKAKSTVEEMKAQSNMASQYNSVVASIYNRAYKVVKGKISSGQDLMNCLRKIISSRNADSQTMLMMN